MAGSAVLERELNKQDTRATKVREVAYEEQMQTPSAFYDFLRAPQATWTSPAPSETERREVKNVQAPVYDPTAERVKSYYQTPSAPARKKVLFDNYEYINGELMEKDPETDRVSPAFASTVYAEPTYVDFETPLYAEPQESFASAASVEQTEEEEDALPTRRTMETVIRPAAAVQEMAITETRTGFKAALSALSAKTKAILLSVAAAIVLAIILICVNTSIIRSLDSDLTNLKGRATEQQTTYENLQRESDLYTDPDSEIVTDWAIENGMTK
ncbi:MAG: hypothetical protein K2L02_00465 [Clostridia bacterium]|nr:hypothetical protein [Clostridia bacterium]